MITWPRSTRLARRYGRAGSWARACGLAVSVAAIAVGVPSQVGADPVGAGWTSPDTGSAGPVQTSFAPAFAYSLAHANVHPAGANLDRCTPSAAHPYPVVLAHATTGSAYANWASLSPRLAAAGYCVYAVNFGAAAWSPIKGIGPMTTSARELGAFIDHVLKVTGASKVDIVGHSQGATLPRMLLKQPGWSSRIDKVIGLAATNYGGTFSGALTTIRDIPGGSAFLEQVAPAFVDWTVGSPLLAELNSGSDTVPGVGYTSIASRGDQVVTPYTNAFLRSSAATNETLQTFCPADTVDHFGLTYDATAQQLVLNALDPAHQRTPTC